jgi:outer membrane protein OmpA-like peptidoglycan-associated protein/uncharacterized protein YidB (DUF937 family)
MLDMIIREAAAKFGLGDKGGMIVSALLGMMFKKDSGGLGGFLDMFKQKGLANLATSWLGGGSGLPLGINPTQLENVIGGDLMKGLASKTGLPIGPISSALAFMLPNIVRSLTADGKVPTGIPAAISQYMSGDGASAVAGAGAAAVGAAAATVGAAGKAAVGSAAEKAGAAAAAAGAAGKAAIGGAAGNVAGAAASMAPAAAGGLPKWLWVLIPVVLALGWFLMRKPAETPVAQAPKAAPAVEAPKPAPVVEAPKPTEAPAPAPASVAAAPKDAGAQLDALKAAGNVSGEDLVKALNMTNIRFATGSATITPESMDIVKKAAETIKAAAAGTKIEVGGHTDNVGNPASNMKLSDARAQSVLSALIGLGVGKGVLSAKGYGDSKPVAANDTAENKAKNRRMEYSLVK